MLASPAVRGVDFMSQIPPELLGEIFSYSSLLDPNAPLVLNEVSSSFRRVVRSTPQAWSRLCLSVSQADMNSDTDAKCIRKTDLWFSMAAVLPVDVEIKISSEPGPSSDKGRNHTHILISTHNHSAMQQDFQSSLADMFLPQVLRSYNHRILGLDLHTTTVNEAQIFLEAIYPPPSVSVVFPEERTVALSERTAEELPLERLILHASSDGSRQAPKLLHPRVATSTPRINLPNLPHLTHLKFHNHHLPYLSLENVKNLRSLSIQYPLRFSPISIYTLLYVLESTTSLESLEVEGRVLDGFHSPSSPSSPTLTPATPSFDQNSPWDMASLSPSSEASSIAPPSLINLPHLTHLNLRVNDLPAILSHLLLPSLHTLKIDDLDGNRAGAAKQTAEVIRGLLVRMELPCEGRKGHGLQVLDLCNVALSSSSNHTNGSGSAPGHQSQLNGTGSGHGHTRGAGIEQDTETAETVWAWCFRRMLKLEELVVKNVDTNALFDIITPKMSGWESSSLSLSSASSRCDSGAVDDPNAAPLNSMDDVSLPRLRKLTITHQVHNHRTNYHHHPGALDWLTQPHPSHKTEFGGMAYYPLASSPSTPSSSSSLFSSSSTLSPFSPQPSSSLSPVSTPSPASSMDDPRSISGPILKFHMRRPDVEMVYPSVYVPKERNPSPAPVDFLALYLH